MIKKKKDMSPEGDVPGPDPVRLHLKGVKLLRGRFKQGGKRRVPSSKQTRECSYGRELHHEGSTFFQ